MADTIVVALIAAGASICAQVIISFRTNSIINYRLGELEKKVEKHNQIVERMAVMEKDIKTAFIRIDNLKDDIKEIQHDIER